MSGRFRQARKRISRALLILITRAMEFFSRIVPYRLGVWSGGALGIAAYYLLPRERKRALAHLSQVFGDKGGSWIRGTARRCFLHLGKSLLETMLMSPERLSRVVDIEGEDNIKQALGQGKGVVYVTGHLGNWELMAHTVGTRYPLSVIAAPIEPEQVNDLIVGLRARMGVRTILRSRPGAAKELIRAFRENRILGLLIDQDTDVESAFVDFMGRPAWTPTAAASMAIKFGAPVIFGHIRRNRDDRHTVTIEGPLKLSVTGDVDKDIIDNTAMLTKMIEDRVREFPEQWVWMHRRWRRQP